VDGGGLERRVPEPRRAQLARAVLIDVIGFLYFTLMALSEVTLWAWVYRWQVWAQRRAGR
jgi:hypothetical protein